MIKLNVNSRTFFEDLKNHFEEFGFVMIDSKSHFAGFKFGKRHFYITNKHSYKLTINDSFKKFNRKERTLEIYPEKIIEHFNELEQKEKSRKESKNVLGLTNMFFEANLIERMKEIGFEIDNEKDIFFRKNKRLGFSKESFLIEFIFRSTRSYKYLSECDMFKEIWNCNILTKYSPDSDFYYNSLKCKKGTLNEILENLPDKLKKLYDNS